MVSRIKHMAVAVADVDAAVGAYERRLGISEPRRVEWAQGKSKEAHFVFGEVEIQLCESTDPEGRFAQHGETVRAEHTYSGIDDLTRLPYVARMRLEAQVGARAVGAVYGEATLTTTDGAVRCSSGPVTFALSR